MRTRLVSLALVLVLLVAALAGCSSKEETSQATSLHIVIAAPFATEDQANALHDALSTALPGLNSEETSLTVSAVATGDTEKDPMGAMAGMTQLSARMMSNELELLLCDADNARRHGDNGETYVPLNELFTEAEIAELDIVPATIPLLDDNANYTGEQSAPCGVDLSTNETLVQMFGIPDLGACVIIDSQNLDNAKTVIKALLTM